MAELISYLRQSAFFIGCLIGALIVAVTPRIGQACPVPSTEADFLAWSGTPYEQWTSCMQSGWSQAVEDNQKVARAAFGENHVPGLFYRVIGEVDGPGIYQGFARDGTLFDLVVFVSGDPITQDSAGQAFLGDGGGRTVIGEIQGPTGAFGIMGLLVHTTRANGELDQMLFVDAALSESQTQTWRTTGYLAITAKDPLETTENEQAFMNTSGQSQEELRNCLKPDFLTVLSCIGAAMVAAGLCKGAANVAMVKALIACTANIGWPIFGAAAAAICIAAVIALRAAAIKACATALAAALAACLSIWGDDVLNCKLEEMVGW